MAVDNIYDEVRELIISLRNNGMEADGEKLADAMISGSTGIEIFMALNLHLGTILEKGFDDNLHLRERTTQLRDVIKTALR